MTYATPADVLGTVPSYAALRRGGAPPLTACRQLGVNAGLASRLERVFLQRVHRGGEMQPRFARHQLHVAAALAAGGFPTLPEPRR